MINTCGYKQIRDTLFYGASLGILFSMVHSVIRLCVAILCIVLNNYVTYITVTSHSAVVIIILLI